MFLLYKYVYRGRGCHIDADLRTNTLLKSIKGCLPQQSNSRKKKRKR